MWGWVWVISECTGTYLQERNGRPFCLGNELILCVRVRKHKVQIFPPAGFIWLYSIYFYRRCSCFASNLSSSILGYVSVLRALEKPGRKTLARDVFHTFPTHFGLVHDVTNTILYRLLDIKWQHSRSRSCDCQTTIFWSTNRTKNASGKTYIFSIALFPTERAQRACSDTCT